MANSDDTMYKRPMLEFLPVFIAEVHPHAAERYLRFMNELRNEVPLEQVADEDFTAQELANLVEFVNKLTTWLNSCRKDAGESALRVYPYSTAVIYDMSNLKELLKTAYMRKMEKVRLEAERKRRLAALKKINPPFDDAAKFLTEAENALFVEALPGAISAYLDGGKGCLYKDWQFDARAGGYIGCLGIIKRRKEEEARKKQVQKGEEARKKQAQQEREQYNKNFNAAVQKLKADLKVDLASKKLKFVYPMEFDKYQPEGWYENIELPSKEKVENWVRNKVMTLIPEILTDFIRWQPSWKVRVIPHASYEVAGGVPTIRWTSTGYVQATVTLKLAVGAKAGIKASSCDLGTTIFNQPEWSLVGAFTTPVALLRLLVEGKLEGPGISVTERDEPFTTFFVQGYGEEVEVVDDFVAFIQDIGKEKPLAEALLERGVIDQDVAELLKMKWDLALSLLSCPEVGNKEGTDDDLVAALEALGLKKAEIMAGIEAATLTQGMTFEEKLKVILKNTGM